ncbi:TetR/AcrR family transcriptional regulator [Bailinhaonella thermotolerans]|uniref:TetR/AcrR family transcriptional regulator n=1 Tax=Bailinhaonella thermotolerans TaxID=1070861 RepID=UPI00192A4CD7|nr:TetR/AcrR family transcriptional regulator [Bailinhaonella thermotolerans]
MAETRRPRRSPGERKRDPERTRERILEAATEEFGEKGYAGARVSAIARRAGVNAQLISYYFDGKAGLYRALSQRWEALSSDISRDDAPLDEVVAAFVTASQGNRAWTRLLAWENLASEETPGDAGGRERAESRGGQAESRGQAESHEHAEDRDQAGGRRPAEDRDGSGETGAEWEEGDFMRAMAHDLARRKEAGELAPELDPALTMLALFAAAAAGTLLPKVARQITGLDPESPEFTRRYAEQLAILTRRLRP